MTDRAAFMAKVREALGDPSPPKQAPLISDALVRLAGHDDVAGRFETSAREVGATIHRVTPATLVARTVALLAELNVKRAVATTSIEDDLREAGIELVDWRGPGGMDASFDVDAGITDVHAALAESGTLVCSTDAHHGRAPSLVPRIHIAIVRAMDIVPDMLDLWPRYRGIAPSELPSSITLITGPSKTADIEGQLIKGVHGPGRVEIMLVVDE